MMIRGLGDPIPIVGGFDDPLGKAGAPAIWTGETAPVFVPAVVGGFETDADSRVQSQGVVVAPPAVQIIPGVPNEITVVGGTAALIAALSSVPWI